MILTLRSENVIVPGASVAEMVSAQGAMEVNNMPDWYVAKMRWHGVDVPLVSFEAAGGEAAKPVNQNTQIAMIYTASDDESRYPYIGLVVSGVPHVTQVSHNQIVVDPESLLDAHSHPMVAQKTRINGAAVNILDIDGIENMIKEAEAA
ncbi:MAG: chemotaxis protein CheW [Gammaproteobacteria bacterium]|nr:chemotaxis protein CheW [Gammaproteobacteria bacterium]